MSSIFSSNSEADALELLEMFEELSPRYIRRSYIKFNSNYGITTDLCVYKMNLRK